MKNKWNISKMKNIKSQNKKYQKLKLKMKNIKNKNLKYQISEI